MADPAPAPGETPPPAELTKEHGLLKAAEHSNRSPVATLRQWVDHPELREQLGVPDLAPPDNSGRGFEKALSAYRAAAPEPVPVEPVPVEPLPVEPLPVEPAPVEPAPVEPLPVEPLPVEPLPVEVPSEPV